MKTALARIACRQLELATENSGYDRVLATAGWLGTELNTTRTYAQRILTRLQDAGWIRKVGQRGRAPYWRLTRLESEELRGRAWAYAATVDAFSNGAPADDPLALLLSTVGHCSWAYSEDLGPAAFLAAAAELVRPEDAATLGLSSKLRRKKLAAVDAALPGWRNSSQLSALLDLHGEESLAVFIKTDRLQDFAEESAQNRARWEAARAAKAELWDDRKYVRSLIRESVDDIGVPPNGDDTSACAQWVTDVAGFVRRTIRDTSLLPALRIEITGLVQKRGWTDSMAEKAVAYIEGAAA